MAVTLEPVTLKGDLVRLEPLAPGHADALRDAARDGRLWELWYTTVPHPDDMDAEIERRLKLLADGSMLPFAVVERDSGTPVGMTTYMNVDLANDRYEIGSTWYAARVQRTGLNSEAKLLLLFHAFDSLGAIAVEFRTHAMNHQSRRAIERLGAKLDGILRNHTVMANGTLRDTAVYSILPHEWPAVRANLTHQLARHQRPAVQ